MHSSHTMQNHSDIQKNHMAEIAPGKLTAVNVMSGATPPSAENGSAYMTILNGLDKPIRLVSASSEVADLVQLHETTEEAGVMHMNHQPDGFVIDAGGILLLEPGGKHVMLMGLKEPLEADSKYSIMLHFADVDPITATVAVMAMGDMERGSMKHNHEEK